MALKTQKTNAMRFNENGNRYELKDFVYNYQTTANELAQMSTDLISEVAIRGVVVPKAALSSWIIPHSDGTFSGWIEGNWKIIDPDEQVLILLKSPQYFRDQITRANWMLATLESLEAAVKLGM